MSRDFIVCSFHCFGPFFLLLLVLSSKSSVEQYNHMSRKAIGSHCEQGVGF